MNIYGFRHLALVFPWNFIVNGGMNSSPYPKKKKYPEFYHVSITVTLFCIFADSQIFF